jgi:Predicted integral membrane protein (DUF2275)/Putative zinc-finger
MDHSDIRRNLSAYLDNALGSEQKEEVKRHLGMCGSCREALADLEWTVAQFRLAPEVEAPFWLTARIMANLRDKPAPAPGIWRRLLYPLHIKLPLEAAAIALICMTGYYFARTAPHGLPISVTAPPAGNPATATGTAPPATPAQEGGTPTRRQFKGAELPSEPPPAPAAIPAPPVPAASSPPVREPPALSASPALTEASQQEPGLQPAGEWPAMGRETDRPFSHGMKGVQRKAAGKTRGYGADEVAARGTLRVGEADVSLEVINPATAGESIEREIGSVGGKIRGDSSSDDNHLLLVQIDARKLPALLDRLTRIGALNARPQVAGEGKVNLSISW